MGKPCKPLLSQLSISFAYPLSSLLNSQCCYSISLHPPYAARPTVIDGHQPSSNKQELISPRDSPSPLQSSHSRSRSPENTQRAFHPRHPLLHPLSPKSRSPNAHKILCQVPWPKRSKRSSSPLLSPNSQWQSIFVLFLHICIQPKAMTTLKNLPGPSTHRVRSPAAV